jgi:hypothetical protein
MLHVIDHSLYPDEPAPADLSDEGDAADYIHRVCGALDFGIVPEREVVETMRDLRPVFDKFPLTPSPAYHMFRRLFGWPPVPALPPLQLRHEFYDQREGRGPDPCLEMI